MPTILHTKRNFVLHILYLFVQLFKKVNIFAPVFASYDAFSIHYNLIL